MNYRFLTYLLLTLPLSVNTSAKTSSGDSLRVVKGQVSNYYIPVVKDYELSGKVTDAAGKPLAGATVMFFASPVHCNTDAQGRFSLRATDTDVHLYVSYPGKKMANVVRSKDQHNVNIVMVDGDNSVGEEGTGWCNGTNVSGRQPAQATPWYDPKTPGTTTYCNPLNISYNYEPYNQNVKQGGSFRSSADPMGLTYKGQYLLFSTNQGGYHYSKNLSDWDFQTASFQRHPTDDDQCAPAAFVAGDTLFYTGSTYEGLPVWYTLHPETGRWRQAVSRSVLPSWDPCLFLDDDGSLYLYYGSSNEYPLKAVKLSRQTFAPISKIYDVMMLHPEDHGWERFGMNNDDETTLRPFTEGAFMTKHNGKYYLQYGAPGTEFKVYADGVYVSDSPLGPFTYQRHNPMCYKPGGFVLGAGHGGTFADLHGQYWHVATCMLSLKYKFERRIGLYPVYFDGDGVMWSDTSFGDYPQRNADYTGKDRFTGWMLLSLGKPVTASSTDSVYVASNLSDENIRTFWSAKSGNAGEWIMMDLQGTKEVRAFQLNYYDRKTVQTNRANDTYYQYRVWASNDGQHWTLAVDKSDNDRDVPHDYVELRKPLNTRYLKVENLHMPGRGNFCLSDFRVFGRAQGVAPAAPKAFKAERSKADQRNAMLSWRPVKDAYGYNIYYGVAKDKLYHCITVNGNNTYDLRGLDVGTSYWFAIQSLAETGTSSITKPQKL
ncbi:MAG: family 43 glycosylhydrolase [Prevotella sp.]|jgi:xylan 1,4-beta-xylosidase